MGSLVLTWDNSDYPKPRQEEGPGGTANGNAVAELPPEVARYIDAALAENTLRAYQGDLSHFRQWGGRLPASPEEVARYLAQHAEALSAATLTRRLAGLAKAHRAMGMASPTESELVRLTMRGIRRQHGRPQQQVKPLTRDVLRSVLGAMGDSLREARDRALLVTGFAGALRPSELAAIECRSLEPTAHGLILTIPRSKTDPEGQGHRIKLEGWGEGLDPKAALERWLARAGIEQGPVFRSLDRHGHLGGQAISANAVAQILKRRLREAGIDAAGYAGHSLRAGFATSAALDGVPAWQIRRQTRHAAAAMVERYIREADLLVEREFC